MAGMSSTTGDWNTRENKVIEGEVSEGKPQAPSTATIEHDSGDSFDMTKALSLCKEAEKTGREYMVQEVRRRWIDSYRAFENKHATNSKYLGKEMRGRSKFFRPKTRTNVKKHQAAAAGALFSTADVVQVSAENNGNQAQLLTAKLLKGVLNYRLDRTSGTKGIPWFHIAMGAHQDARITGICASKQYWEYKEEPDGFTKEIFVDEETGEEYEESVPKMKVVRDRPMIDLFPAENVLRDPHAGWIDPVNDSSFLILVYPMTVQDVRKMVKGPGKSGVVEWLEEAANDTVFKTAVNDYETQSIRRARENTGHDRLNDNRTAVKEFNTIWVYENFIKTDQGDMHFWSIGSTAIISKPKSVSEVYPEQNGDRPVILGYGELESHKITPTSGVEALKNLQQETNDISNLSLDITKQHMSPVTKIKRGRNINVQQVQNRSPRSTIFVDNMDDIEFDQPPNPGAGRYQEIDRLNADFDALGGSFDASSVATNRNMNETVGGMKMLRSSATMVADFDLRVWIETWVEPVLRQLINCEKFYESDKIVLELATAKMQEELKAIVQRSGLTQERILDYLLDQEVTCRVDVGMGNAQPDQKLEKLTMAAQTAIAFVGERLQARIDEDAVIEEVFGLAGYDDGKRFFKDKPMVSMEEVQQMQQEMQQQMQQLQQELQKVTQMNAKLQVEMANREKEIASKEKIARLDNMTELSVEEMRLEQKAADRGANARMELLKLKNAKNDNENKKVAA